MTDLTDTITAGVTTGSDIAAVLDAQLADTSRVEPIDEVPEGTAPLLSVLTHRNLTHELVDLEALVAKHRPHPKRATGTTTCRTLDGVGQAIDRLANPDIGIPVLYHDAESLTVTVVLNDHDGRVGGDEQPAGWRDHRIHWQPTLTPEWKHWTGHQGLVGQLEFAEILEDGEAEIAEPPVAEMLEIVRTLHATRNAKYRASGRPSSGVTQFVYEETSEAKAGEKGNLTIPDEFVVVVRPFFGSDPYRVKARIRYRAQGDSFRIGYQLHRPDDVIRQAFDAHVAALIGDLEDVDTIEGLA